MVKLQNVVDPLWAAIFFARGSLLREGDSGGPTLFRSHFSNFLSAQGPIFKFLSIWGHDSFICLLEGY